MFWWWPEIHQNEVRDGLKSWIRVKRLLNYWKKQQWPSDTSQRRQLIKKVQKVVADTRQYVQSGLVSSLTGFFAVPKGKADMRVEYDATKCGLNDALWAPNFYLPTIDTILCNSDLDSWHGDVDLGEMFLNYPLDPGLKQYAGIDITALLHPGLSDKELGLVKREIRCWVRCLVGLKTSPVLCTKAFAWSEEVMKGDRRDDNNILHWDKVILNLPGSPSYDPSFPWVYKLNLKVSRGFRAKLPTNSKESCIYCQLLGAAGCST
mmetsp:Transcript_785/g.1178  ORF Transcript_785/g.1178 Transcript_785/m.1178 type:complete len:263 (+) Transcript_785:4218-5006(+)